ncbi:MAG: trypsin-like peptidase domain-containing protein [Alphaproteobacteria bacterium]|nr:trypsin-like peptidase domain-containing protein [Alphaproteobacteria bacterium]
MLKRICIVVAITISHCTLAFSSTLPGTISHIKQSVVSVATVMLTRTPRVIFYGTGFVVANGRYVITNDHVVPKKIKHEKKEALVIFTGEGSKPIPRYAKLVLRDEVHDLALLKIKGAPLPAVTIGSSSNVREGERFAFTGFPIGMVLGQYPVTHEGIVSGKPPIVTPAPSSRQLTAEQIKRKRNPFRVFQLDAIAYPGNSGSPVYRVDTGHVIGVVNSVFVKKSKEAVLSAPSGITYAIPSKYINALLKKAGLQ